MYFHPNQQKLDKKITVGIPASQSFVALRNGQWQLSVLYRLQNLYKVEKFPCTTYRPITAHSQFRWLQIPASREISLHYASANDSICSFLRLQKLDKKISFSYSCNMIPASKVSLHYAPANDSIFPTTTKFCCTTKVSVHTSLSLNFAKEHSLVLVGCLC